MKFAKFSNLKMLVLFLLATLGLGALAQAAAPYNSLSLQGYVKAQSGTPVNGTFNGQITLYQNSAPCWSTGPTLVPIVFSNGAFAKTLSGGVSTGVCSGALGSSQFFTTGPFTWTVGLDMSGTGTIDTTFTGIPVTPVPLAMAAELVTGPVATSQLIGTLSANMISGGTLGALDGSNLTNLTAANLSGALPAISGAALTNLNASALTSGSIPPTRLGTGTPTAANFLRGDGTWSTLSFSGSNISGGTFGVVNGSALTNLNASALTTGVVAPALLGSGTASSLTFLRGDGAWATPISSGIASSGINFDITSLMGLTTPLPLSEGGVGAVTAAGARANLGAAASGINTDITQLNGLTGGLTVANGALASGTIGTTPGSLVLASGTAGGSFTFQMPVGLNRTLQMTMPSNSPGVGQVLSSVDTNGTLAWVSVPAANGGNTITSVGTVTTGVWNASPISSQYGGTGINTATSTGVPTIAFGSWSVNSTLPISMGGTGSTTAIAAYNALAPTTTAGDIVYANGAGSNTRLAGNTTATKNFLTMTASVPSWGTITASDIPILNQNTTGTASNITGVLGVANGGTNLTAYVTGDLLYASGSTTLSRLADVATGYVLVSGGVGAAPVWSNSPTIAGNLTVSGSITPSSTAGIVGTQVGDNASAGSIGEVLTATTASNSVALVSGTAANIMTGLALSKGDWDCTPVANFTPTATTSLTSLKYGLSATSATLGAQDTYVNDTRPAWVPGVAAALTYRAVDQRFNISTATTIYLVANATFSVSTLRGGGTISCRRMR